MIPHTTRTASGAHTCASPSARRARAAAYAATAAMASIGIPNHTTPRHSVAIASTACPYGCSIAAGHRVKKKRWSSARLATNPRSCSPRVDGPQPSQPTHRVAQLSRVRRRETVLELSSSSRQSERLPPRYTLAYWQCGNVRDPLTARASRGLCESYVAAPAGGGRGWVPCRWSERTLGCEKGPPRECG